MDTFFRIDFAKGKAVFLKPEKGTLGHKFHGKRNIRGSIDMRPKGFRKSIQIMCDRSSSKREYTAEDVDFYVNFTSFGPLAFSVTKSEEYLTSKA